MQTLSDNTGFPLAAITAGRMGIARQVLSPNYGERPQTSIDLLVIHSISLPPGEFGGPYVDAFFQNCLDPARHSYFAEICHLQVSAHLLIDRAGAITQYVSFDDRAWHAGESSFCGRSNCNDYSIGIELEGCDDQPFTDVQYRSLVEAMRLIRHAYPLITPERIVGHSDIAPGRKTDPGPLFDWQRVLGALNSQQV
jgi:AmpD protein